MESTHYDLLVIGAGPAGEKGAAQAAYFGKKVAIIEKAQRVGGAIMNTGVTGKALRETSLYINGFNMRDLYGIDLTYKKQLRVKEVVHRSLDIRNAMVNRVNENIDLHNIDLIKGSASFIDKHTVEVINARKQKQRLTGDIILIATGSKPVRPSIFPMDADNVFDSDSILKMAKIPESMVIVGNGTIGCEYACTFSQLGVAVTVIGMSDELFPFADREIIAILKEYMEEKGIRFLMGEKVTSMDAHPKEVAITLGSGKKVIAAAALIAVGRQSRVKNLSLENAGIKVNDRGEIQINRKYQTAAKNVYAAGDVIGFPALCSTSMEQARMAMVNAFDLKYKSDVARILPFGIWTIPEVAMVGETEKTLTAKKIKYVVGKTYYKNNPRGATIGEKKGMLKLIFKASDTRLVGVHIIGEQACELISVGMMALNSESTFSAFIDACFSFPSLSDMYKYATYDAMNNLNNKHFGEV